MAVLAMKAWSVEQGAWSVESEFLLPAPRSMLLALKSQHVVHPIQARLFADDPFGGEQGALRVAIAVRSYVL